MDEITFTIKDVKIDFQQGSVSITYLIIADNQTFQGVIGGNTVTVAMADVTSAGADLDNLSEGLLHYVKSTIGLSEYSPVRRPADDGEEIWTGDEPSEEEPL